jgi:hypothetical protein
LDSRERFRQETILAQQKVDVSNDKDLKDLENTEMQLMIARYKQKVEHLQRLEIRLKWRTQRLNSKSNLQTLFEYSSWDEQQNWISTLPPSGIMCPDLESEEDWISEFIPKTNLKVDDPQVIVKRSESEETLVVDNENEVTCANESDDEIIELGLNVDQVLLENMDVDVEFGKKDEATETANVISCNDVPCKWTLENSPLVFDETIAKSKTYDFSLKWLLNPDNDVLNLIKYSKELPTDWDGLTEYFKQNLSYLIHLEASLVSRCALQCMIRDDPNNLSPKDLRWHLRHINGAFLSIEFSCHSNLSEILFWRGLNVGKLSTPLLVTKVLNALVAFNFLNSDFLEFYDSGFRTEKALGRLLFILIFRLQVIEFCKSPV